jgi:assimilatory nitrate reductase catalytic subunit
VFAGLLRYLVEHGACNRTSLPEREDLAALLGSQISFAERIGCLAGLAAEAGLTPDTGRIVCACFAVGLRRLQRAVHDQRLSSVVEIGAALRAGTNCGSCIPELKEILYEAGSRCEFNQ